MKQAIHGILPALVTPLTAAGELAVPALEQLLARCYAAGVDGVYVGGQTGEGLLLPLSIREQAAELAIRCSPAGKVVMVHVGAARTEDAVRLARHAARAGAGAISSLPPIGGYGFNEIRDYYARLAAVADLPLLVYYFPEVAPNIRTEEQILELAALPQVIGLKYTDFDLYRLARLRQAGLTVFNGRDEVLAAGLLMGASGGIGSFYNLTPDLFVQLYRHAQAGEWAAAKSVQDRINELIGIVLRFPLFPAIKQVLTWSGIDCGQCVEPRRPLTPGEEQALAERLAQSSFAPATLGGVPA